MTTCPACMGDRVLINVETNTTEPCADCGGLGFLPGSGPADIALREVRGIIRAGLEPLVESGSVTPAVAAERANNIAQSLVGWIVEGDSIPRDTSVD